MSISTEIKYAKLDELYLDPLNTRLGRNNTGSGVPQDKILELMKDWTLDELAISYLESGGFWVHEALLVTKEMLYGREELVVIEGNRRLAALKLLQRAYQGEQVPSKWKEIAATEQPDSDLFNRIPYIFVSSRIEIESFLGFRHVTGIKEWRPAEKAEFITKLIENHGLSYDEVRKKIGSKTPTVRQNYIAYKIFQQIEDTVEEFPADQAENRFSVMYLSLATKGAQKYLEYNTQASTEEAKRPIPPERAKSLQNYSKWVFGTENTPPLFSDSRDVNAFGHILESPEAIEYLENTDRPVFDFALQKANADVMEIIRLISQATDNIELSLTRVHLHKTEPKLRSIIKRLFGHIQQLQGTFPDLSAEVDKGEM